MIQTEVQAMRIALFSDVHGHLRLMLHSVRNWQIAHASLIDAVLVAGDLGCFPDPAKFDRSTRRWIEIDPEEAGFSHYFTAPHPEITQFHAEPSDYSTVRCPILFVPGNHEDYDYLLTTERVCRSPSSLEDTFPVDCYGQIHCLRDGTVTRIHHGGPALSVAGIWGIENARPDAPYRIKPAAIRRLQELGRGSFDLLLTHDAPAGAYPVGGSQEISSVITTCSPRFHLFGHVPHIHGQNEFQLPTASTRCFLLKDLSFGRDGNDDLMGAMAVLEWNGKESSIEVVQDEWLSQMRFKTWQQVCPQCTVEAS